MMYCSRSFVIIIIYDSSSGLEASSTSSAKSTEKVDVGLADLRCRMSSHC